MVYPVLVELQDGECNLTLEELLQLLEIEHEEYKNALKISQKGDVIIL